MKKSLVVLLLLLVAVVAWVHSSVEVEIGDQEVKQSTRNATRRNGKRNRCSTSVRNTTDDNTQEASAVSVRCRMNRKDKKEKRKQQASTSSPSSSSSSSSKESSLITNTPLSLSIPLRPKSDDKQLRRRDRLLGKKFDWSDFLSERLVVQQGRRQNKNKKAQRCNNLSEISCGGGKCAPLADICDGHMDCKDRRDERNCEEMEVRLVGGTREGEGRVEITINNITGTICSLGWNDKAARVICRMFAFKNTHLAKAVTGAKFGKGSGVIWLSQVSCSGSERDINYCHSPVWGDHRCTHDQDAGVVCIPHKIQIEAHATISESQSWDQPVCGKRPILQPHPKILGGRPAMYGALPWQARVLKMKDPKMYHQCGGTIIDKKWVVTAAHCLEGLTASSLGITVGDYDTNKTELWEQVFTVEMIVLHPDYESAQTHVSVNIDDLISMLGMLGRSSASEAFINDIALLKIRPTNGRFIEFNSHVQPACLPTSTTPYHPGLRCEVSGWGLINNNPMRLPDKLYYGVIPIMSTYDCEKSYRGLFKHRLPVQMFCAGYAKGGVDTCQGDSGGPLVCSIHGTHTLMGVTSWGFECGKSTAPGIYTKVGMVTDWMHAVLKDTS